MPYYTPDINDALGFSGFSGVVFQDPEDFTTTDPTRVDAKFFLKPIQDQAIAAAMQQVATVDYNRLYTCPSWLNVNDPVYVSGNGTVGLATGATAAESRVVGFVSQKDSSTTCWVSPYAYHASGFSGTAGNPIYLSNAGYPNPTVGTVPRTIGTYISASGCLMEAGPTLNSFSSVSGFSGFSGASGFSGSSGVDGISGFSGYSGVGGGAMSYATMDQSVTSSTTFADSTYLQYSVPSSGSYRIRVMLAISAYNSSGIRVGFDGPTKSNFFVANRAGSAFDAILTDYTGTQYVTLIPGGSPDTDWMWFDGTLLATASGTLKVQFCQDTSDGNPCQILQGSYMQVNPIS